MMNRRTFLKIMLGTAPGMAIMSLQAAVWPGGQNERTENDPVSIYIDKNGHLYDPGYEDGPVTRYRSGI